MTRYGVNVGVLTQDVVSGSSDTLKLPCVAETGLAAVRLGNFFEISVKLLFYFEVSIPPAIKRVNS